MRNIQFISAAILFVLATPVSASFTDVYPAHPNSDAIEYVQAEGIVEGYSDGSFRPDQTINRVEFVKIIVEARVIEYKLKSEGMGIPPAATPCFFHQSEAEFQARHGRLPDVDFNAWYAKYVCNVLNYKIAQGYPDGTFRPNDQINFVEAAKIIVRSGIGASDEWDEYSVRDIKEDSEIWFRPYVQELEERNAIPTNITSFDQRITRGEMAEMIYRLQAGVTSKPSQTYENLVSGGEQEQQLTTDGMTFGDAQDGDVIYTLPYRAWVDADHFYMTKHVYGPGCWGSVCEEANERYSLRSHTSTQGAFAAGADEDGWLLSPNGEWSVRVVQGQEGDQFYGTVSIKNMRTGGIRLGQFCSYNTGVDDAYKVSCYGSPVWSPDSRYIGMYHNNGDVVVLPAEAQSLDEVIVLGNSSLPGIGGVGGDPLVWSPDSKKIIAWINFDVFSVPDQRRIYHDTNPQPWALYGDKRWSPHSDQYLLTQLRGDRFSVLTMNLDGSTPDEIFSYEKKEGYYEYPSADFSPDGTKIALTNGVSLLLYDKSTRRVTELSNEGEQYSHVRWSPDGKRIIYVRDGNIWEYRVN